ncbi:zinc-ribbon and DUF3426 domain-containing protein [Nitrosospira briensis]|uniref:zinc-ribbon and DUF3426 domain-containing protein n=1 Tax=Nitrosospira briensis TaxID=35799 RepID=UPI000469E4D3|nr:zinc-ribbon and DUF3426 domain-containing protein [Nitrosospira briensis]
MALVTRCPNCAAAFRVTPLHLQAHGGDVRCGQCAQVFNGFATLATVQEPEDRDEAGPEAKEMPETEAAPEGESGIPPQNDPDTLAVSNEENSPSAPAQETTRDQFGSGMTARAAPASSAPPIAEESAPQREGETGSSTAASSADGETRFPHRPNAAIPPPENYAWNNYAFDEVRLPKASLAWGVGSLFLIAMLVAQAIYIYRAELSVNAPATRPYLQRYCELLGCTIPSPQYAKLLNIESSDMQPDTQQPGVITLSATIRNHAPNPQAFPSFQLTLIDRQDRPLASRNFPPEAYLEDAASRGKVIAPNAEFNVRLHLDSGTLNVAGYRLLLLNPRS